MFKSLVEDLTLEMVSSKYFIAYIYMNLSHTFVAERTDREIYCLFHVCLEHMLFVACGRQASVLNLYRQVHGCAWAIEPFVIK